MSKPLTSAQCPTCCLQDMADDERALRQALAGLEAALKGDLQTLATFREVRMGTDMHLVPGPPTTRLPPAAWLAIRRCCVHFLHAQPSRLQP
jgi:hypothetical protein